MKLPFVHFHQLGWKYFRSILVMEGFCCFLWSSQPWRSNQKVLLFRRNFHLREMSSSGFASIFYCSIKAPELHTHFETILLEWSQQKRKSFLFLLLLFHSCSLSEGVLKGSFKKKKFRQFFLTNVKIFLITYAKARGGIGGIDCCKTRSIYYSWKRCIETLFRIVNKNPFCVENLFGRNGLEAKHGRSHLGLTAKLLRINSQELSRTPYIWPFLVWVEYARVCFGLVTTAAMNDPRRLFNGSKPVCVEQQKVGNQTGQITSDSKSYVLFDHTLGRC